MKLTDFHLLENNTSHQQVICYGPIEEYLEEMEPELKDNYTEIPFEKYPINMLIEITGDMLEDSNYHNITDMPAKIHRLMQESGISEENILTFFQNYAKFMFDRYGY